ncbi:hypothetical protein MHU86_1233 [Fragilaria crotonensis]|nr:hypothetical protein MHU86_1233 [Fragilaria crotonensis]
MQVRLNDVIVNDTPRFLTDNVTDLTHSLVIPVDDTDTPYVIPLSIQGVTSSFPTRRPTVDEYESLPHLSLTSADVPYDPADSTYAEQERALTQAIFETGDRVGAPPPSRRLCSVSKMHSYARNIGIGLDGASLSIRGTSPTFDDGTFLRSLKLGYRPPNSASNGGCYNPAWRPDGVAPDVVASIPDQRPAAEIPPSRHRLLYGYSDLKHDIEAQ